MIEITHVCATMDGDVVCMCCKSVEDIMKEDENLVGRRTAIKTAIEDAHNMEVNVRMPDPLLASCSRADAAR